VQGREPPVVPRSGVGSLRGEERPGKGDELDRDSEAPSRVKGDTAPSASSKSAATVGGQTRANAARMKTPRERRSARAPPAATASRARGRGRGADGEQTGETSQGSRPSRPADDVETSRQGQDSTLGGNYSRTRPVPSCPRGLQECRERRDGSRVRASRRRAHERSPCWARGGRCTWRTRRRDEGRLVLLQPRSIGLPASMPSADSKHSLTSFRPPKSRRFCRRVMARNESLLHHSNQAKHAAK